MFYAGSFPGRCPRLLSFGRLGTGAQRRICRPVRQSAGFRRHASQSEPRRRSSVAEESAESFGTRFSPRMTMVRKGLFVLSAVAVWVAACSKSFAQTEAGRSLPPVILISVDTLRADHLSCYGYERLQTLNIDALAQGGTLFTQSARFDDPVSHIDVAPTILQAIGVARPNGAKRSSTCARQPKSIRAPPRRTIRWAAFTCVVAICPPRRRDCKRPSASMTDLRTIISAWSCASKARAPRPSKPSDKLWRPIPVSWLPALRSSEWTRRKKRCNRDELLVLLLDFLALSGRNGICRHDDHCHDRRSLGPAADVLATHTPVRFKRVTAVSRMRRARCGWVRQALHSSEPIPGVVVAAPERNAWRRMLTTVSRSLLALTLSPTLNSRISYRVVVVSHPI